MEIGKKRVKKVYSVLKFKLSWQRQVWDLSLHKEIVIF